MKSFDYHQPARILFGAGRINELGDVAASFGQRILLVTTPASSEALSNLYNRVIKILTDSALVVDHFDGVIPKPDLECIAAGSDMARRLKSDVIIGLGGGSSMDAAKAISVEATHTGSCWDYLFYKEKQPEKERLLPIIAVSTTSGTGSQVTQVAVVTNSDTRDKSALYNSNIFPDVALIDPELMLSVPEFVTACTGFDVFCHAFESILNPGGGQYTELMAWEAIVLLIRNLPLLMDDLNSLKLRTKISWADTLAGLCIANSGVTLPHGMGMAIGGMYPEVAHGEALAIVYPACMRFTLDAVPGVYAKLASVFNPDTGPLPETEAAEAAIQGLDNFLRTIGLYKSLSSVSMPENEIELLARQCMVLPDYKANPRVASEEEMIQLVKDSYWR